MKNVLQVLLSSLGLCCGCSKQPQPLLTPAEFTQEFAQALQKASHEIKVEVVDDRQLKVTTKDGRELSPFLYNAYDAYKQTPEEKDAVIQRFVAASLETAVTVKGSLDRTRIVPVIKDQKWLEDMRQSLHSRGFAKEVESVYENFAPGLVIVYAEDAPRNMRYLIPKDLEDAKIERKDLRAIACQNLKRLLPKIERHGSNGVYMLTAGGNYEASLLLLESIWTGGKIDVKGDVVVAIPTRDLLLVTGSKDQDGLAKVKQMVEKAYGEGSYQLTPNLFVFRDGKFDELTSTGQ